MDNETILALENQLSDASTDNQENNSTPNENEGDIVLEQEATITEPATSEPAKLEEDVSNKPDSELTPEQLIKRYKNRQSHKDSKLAQSRKRIRELEERLNKVQSQPSNREIQVDARPDINSFETYEQYTEALLDWKLNTANKQKEVESIKAQQENAKVLENQREQERLRLREAQIAKQTENFMKENPEYVSLVKENAEIFNYISPQAQEVLLKVDNPALAVYALMKEGELESLTEDLSPVELSVLIAEAKVRGSSYVKAKPIISNAPKPMKSVKGIVGNSNDLSSMTPEQVLKWAKS